MKKITFISLVVAVCLFLSSDKAFSSENSNWLKTAIAKIALKIANFNWAGAVDTSKEVATEQVQEKRNVVVGQVSDVIVDAVYKAYPVVRATVVDWIYKQLNTGLFIGVGVTAMGLSIYLVYKIYNSYQSGAVSQEKTIEEMIKVIKKMVSDDLAYPTEYSKKHMLVKKDEFLDFFENTDGIVERACNIVIEKRKQSENIIKLAKKNGNASKNGNTSAANMSSIDNQSENIIKPAEKSENTSVANMSSIDNQLATIRAAIALLSSEQEKLDYITKHYIHHRAKFDLSLYAIISNIEMLTIQMLSGNLSELELDKANRLIKEYKAYLIENLSDEQRAAYSLYLRTKNRIAVQKMIPRGQKNVPNKGF